MRFGVFDHALDVVFVQRALPADRHRLFLVGGPVLGGHVHDAVGVDVEGDFDLRDATRRWRQVDQLELAEGLVVAGHFTLALQHVNFHAWLHVFGGGEDLGATGWDGGVALDQLGHHATLGLNAQAERGDVKQQYVFDVALEHAGLHRGAKGNDFVGVHALVGLFAGDAGNQVANGGHTGGTANQDDVVELALAHAAIFECLLERDAATLDQIGGHFLELGPGERLVKVQRAFGRGSDERQVDLRLLHLAEFDLGLLGCFLQALGGHPVIGQVDAVSGLELLDEPVNDALIPVVATQLGVAVGALHFEHAVADFQHGHVEGAATEVEHQNGFVFGALVETVGKCGSGWLVDDTQYFEAGDLASFLGGGALGIIEVGRDGDHGLGDDVAAVGLGVALQLHQGAGADFL